jgi:hypothetical protein
MWSWLPKMDHCVCTQDVGHSNYTACGYGWFCSWLCVFVSYNIHANLKNKGYFKTLKKKRVSSVRTGNLLGRVQQNY